MAEFILSAFADEASPELSGQIRALKEAGIRCVELRNVNGKNVKDLTNEEAFEVRRELDKNGIRVASMGSPFGKISVTDPFETHMEEFRHALTLCHILGTKKMRMFSFYIPKGEDPANYRNEVLRRLNAMLDAAEQEGILLCHENEKGIYGDTGDRCEDLMNELGDRMGCIFDPANFIQCGDLPADQWPKLESRITYMHIKDALMEDGAVVPSGCGDGSVRDLLASLIRAGKTVELSIEPHLTAFVGLSALQGEELKHRYSYRDNFEAFAAAADALKGILGDLGMTETKGEGIWKL